MGFFYIKYIEKDDNGYLVDYEFDEDQPGADGRAGPFAETVLADGNGRRLVEVDGQRYKFARLAKMSASRFPDHGAEVMHLDDDCTNDKPENLACESPSRRCIFF